MAARRRAPTLAQLIRRSPLLDAAARRRWLDVLPHLTADDQARLREILTSGDLTPQPLRGANIGSDTGIKGPRRSVAGTADVPLLRGEGEPEAAGGAG